MPKRAIGIDGAPAPKLVVGTDFSGLDGVIWILQKLGVPHLHAFSSDNDPNVRQFLAYHHKPMIVYVDVKTRNIKDVPPCDLYVAGPPCVGHSTAGKKGKLTNAQGALWVFCMEYVVTHKPLMVILENVPEFEKDTMSWSSIMHTLETHYNVYHEVMSTHKMGVPQQCERLCLIDIHRI